MLNVMTWPDFLAQFSAESWFFGQLPPLISETLHFGVWQCPLRELAVNETLIIQEDSRDGFHFRSAKSEMQPFVPVDLEGTAYLVINKLANNSEDRFSPCMPVSGVLHASLLLASAEMADAENFVKLSFPSQKTSG